MMSEKIFGEPNLGLQLPLCLFPNHLDILRGYPVTPREMHIVQRLGVEAWRPTGDPKV